MKSVGMEWQSKEAHKSLCEKGWRLPKQKKQSNSKIICQLETVRPLFSGTVQTLLWMQCREGSQIIIYA